MTRNPCGSYRRNSCGMRHNPLRENPFQPGRYTVFYEGYLENGKTLDTLDEALVEAKRLWNKREELRAVIYDEVKHATIWLNGHWIMGQEPDGVERNPLRENPTSTYTAIRSMERALAEGWGKVPYTKYLGNWAYELGSDYILHIRYHGTEVITVDFKNKRVLNVTSGGYGSVSTHAGITKSLRALEELGYEIPPMRTKYEMNTSSRAQLHSNRFGRMRMNPDKHPTLSYKVVEYKGEDPFEFYKKYRMPCWGTEFVELCSSLSECAGYLHAINEDILSQYDIEKKGQQVWLGEEDDWLKECYEYEGQFDTYYILILRDERVVLEKGRRVRK